MRVKPAKLSPILLCAAVLSCAERVDPITTGVQIHVAALELDDITNARYTITVTAGGQTVWSESVDADDYGDGRGALTYVGPCDASPSAQPNTVTLVLDALEAGSADVPIDTWQNPTPVSREVICVANADTPVTFDLVIMRDAVQSFFDVAVDFEDIFCSAKFDCQDALLHDGTERALTGVLAFACAAGAGQETTLYLSDVTVTCAGQAPIVIDPSLGPGQRPLSEAPLFAVGTYFGKEDFPGIAKCYWNTALGFTFAPTSAGAVNPHDCHVTATGTAAMGALPEHTTPALTRYPLISWDVPVTSPTGVLMCDAHPLNGPSLAVRTRYSDLAGELLPHPYTCGGSPGVACSGNTPTVAGAAITVSELGAGEVRVEVDGHVLALTLPPEHRLAQDIGCCIAPCCDTGP